MKQVIQDFKSGRLSVEDVPRPSLMPGFVLVSNHFSLISAGTERSTVSAARASLLGKARQRPDLVNQVLETFRKEGLGETVKRVRMKMETLKELGYSSAGTVLMSLDTRNSFRPGDRVACGGGGYASHAGIVMVPQNLVVRVPPSVGLNEAAFTTLGAIALQGIRQADPKLGDNVCIIGLGLLGQITAQILLANGCRVFGIDTLPEMVKLASDLGCHDARVRTDIDLGPSTEAFTKGYGFDSVIICAAARSNDPIELATGILRKKGIMVVVGAVPMNIQREPHFYKKELELKISCSYGPGRYDRTYEEEAQDYPYGYVRWTENRNMAAFVSLLEDRSINIKPLISHTFDINNAEKAYDIVTGKVQERHIGILLRYDQQSPKEVEGPMFSSIPQYGRLQIGFVGAGSFAQKYLIPFARKSGHLSMVVTAHGVTAKAVGKKYQFARFSTDIDDILSNDEINAVFIVTRHDSHAELCLRALKAGKNVFVEKPLAILEDDLDRLSAEYRRPNSGRLMVGFNRRFSPLGQAVKKQFEGVSEPLMIQYRINAGFIAQNHWTQSKEGGGRLLGEVCHFIDFMQYITGQDPAVVHAECASFHSEQMNNWDNLSILIRFAGGSIGVITYIACGNGLLGKERIEIFGSGKTCVIDDFKYGEIYTGRKLKRIKRRGKGHKEEVEAFLKSIVEGAASPLPFESAILTTRSTFRIADSLRTGLPQRVLNP